MPKIFKLIILFLLGLLLYAQTFDDPFHFDDRVTIIENESIHHLPDWPATVRAILHFQPSRFVTILTFALNYYVHRLDVFGYHLVNVAIHITTACLVWWLGELLLFLRMKSAPAAQQSRRGKKKSVAEPSPLAQAPSRTPSCGL